VNGEYFFRQEDLQRKIKDYICNLSEASDDPDALRLDSEVVLKAIEHHHGLLVERARNIYSFSHLTFQEYFAAREIERERHFEILVQNISNPRWKEVFYLTAEMLRRADDFVKMMKERIAGMLANDKKLQAFLEWANQETNFIQFSYKNIAVRSFYAYVEPLDSERALVSARALNCALNIPLVRVLDFALVLDHQAYNNDSFKFNNDFNNRHFEILFDRALDIGDELFRQLLTAHQKKLPDNDENFYQWWINHGEGWKNEFRVECTERNRTIRNGKPNRDLRFTKEQVELLEQYYAANLLLVECMNRSYVSKQVREEIEATMLLPSKK
jgi:predicted NACHT family NTPase